MKLVFLCCLASLLGCSQCESNYNSSTGEIYPSSIEIVTFHDDGPATTNSGSIRNPDGSWREMTQEEIKARNKWRK